MDTIALVIVRALVVFLVFAILLAVGLSFLNSRLARSMEKNYQLEKGEIERRELALRARESNDSKSIRRTELSRKTESGAEMDQIAKSPGRTDSATILSQKHEHRIISAG